MKLAVLFGGISSEHDISCLSAASILRNLNKDKYEIYPVGITRSGEWFYCPDCDPDRVESGAWERMTGKVKVVLAPDRGMHGMVLLREGEIEVVRLDCVFPVLHGVGGEDGTLPVEAGGGDPGVVAHDVLLPSGFQACPCGFLMHINIYDY